MAAASGTSPQQQQPPLTQDASLQRNVFVRILEEPASKALRFRYECEGRSAGSLPGANSTQDKKSFPKIQVVGYRGRAVVVVSCVTIDPPYRAHPHNLVGKEGCKKGVCTMEIANDDMTCEFSNLGIQCVKKKDIEDSLKVREEIRVDPFRTGFHHKSQPGSIDLNSVRLCFQVFCEGPERGQFKVPLKPVVSEPIYDKKAINDLTIMKLSDCTSPVMGNKEIILLCDKVSKDDIEVRFYEENEETGAVVWESFGDFQPSDVHKQYAICFRTPQYHNLEITSPSRVYIQLRCPSKDTTSIPRPFQYLPLFRKQDKRKWNLVSFSAASGAYNMLSSNNNNNVNESGDDDEPCKKINKSVELEDILAHDAVAAANALVHSSSSPSTNVNSSMNEVPIYDRLNEFMVQRDGGGSGGCGVLNEVENVYDVDLELISQIIKTQEEAAAMVAAGGGIGGCGGMAFSGDELLLSGGAAAVDLFGDLVMDVEEEEDGLNGNVIENRSTVVVEKKVNIELSSSGLLPESTTNTAEQIPMMIPPTRPPKSVKQSVVSSTTTTPVVTTTTTSPPPPLPPKKSPATTPTTTTTKSPTKSSPAAFLKNLFSPTKKKKQQQQQQQANANANVNAQQQPPNTNNTTTSTSSPPPPPPTDNVSTTTSSDNTLIGNYELTEQLGLYVDNEAPLATASEFGDYGDSDFVATDTDTDLKRKRLNVGNCRNLSQYFENNKRPRQSSYPPVAAATGQGPGGSSSSPSPVALNNPSSSTNPPPQTTLVHQQAPSPSPSSQQTQQLLPPQQVPPQPIMYNNQQQQPIQLPSLAQQQQVYIKQEPNYISSSSSPQHNPQHQHHHQQQQLTQQTNQYYYDMILGTRVPIPPAQSNNNNNNPLNVLTPTLTYSGGGIVQRTDGGGGQNVEEQQQEDNNQMMLNSDQFSLPHLSDVNLSLLDQHLSENLNDMNLNNF